MSCPYHKEPADPKAPAVTEPTIDGPGEPIPQPPERLLTGNLGEIDPSFAVSSFWRLADIYGPIYRLNLLNREVIILSDYELINEVCDDSRFEKATKGVMETLRVFIKNGLFTAYSDEHEWYIAHRTLVPAFGPIKIRKMFDKMVDIASQMVLKLAFDVIGLCAFNYRFNCFYTDEPPEFATRMAETLVEAGRRTNRLTVENALRVFSKREMLDNIDYMWAVCDQIVADRKANPHPDADDVLNVMLTVKDPVSGEGLSDELIRYEMATFLVAGHETTSGTFNFLFYNLLQHPDKLQKCYAEVDEVIGDSAIELAHLPRLKYVEASIRETLRYFGPIPILSRHSRRETVLGGRYRVDPGTVLLCNLRGLHHDPAVWGPDANEFRPERFLNGGWEAMPANAWKPFGTGVRACIGRALAEQEMLITCALIFQRFVVEMADPNYELKMRSTLTIKPADFKIKVRRRPGKDRMVGLAGGPAVSAVHTAPSAKNDARSSAADGGDGLKALAIYYGGNTGTCKSFGEDLQTAAPSYGFSVPDGVRNLDDAVENLPTDRPVLIVTSSYEGQPPDNARGFVAWLETRAESSPDMLKGVAYSVLGAGNKDWASTYHRIPKLVDSLMEKMGAKRLFPAAMVDVSEDIVGPFEDWKAGVFPVIREFSGATSEVKTDELKVDVVHPDAPVKLAGPDISTGLVLVNREIVKKGVGPQKKHMEVLLSPGSRYQSGDYLVVLPYNPRASVLRVMNRFGLHPDDALTVTGTNKEYLSATDGHITALELIGARVELATPISQRQVATLAKKLPISEELAALAADDKLYRSEILDKRVSVLDLLEDFPECDLSFSEYVDMLTPLSPRQYSISSSPLAYPAVSSQGSFPSLSGSGNGGVDEGQTSLTCSITYDVFEGVPALSGHGTFAGVSSTYLSNLGPGSRLRCFVRSTSSSKFRLPADPKTPVILVAAGTGIAPMRAFIQERAAIAGARGKTGSEIFASATLYYGCRAYDEDFLYRDELQGWEKDAGVVKVRPAYSRHGPDGSAGGKHVDEVIWEDRDELVDQFKKGGRILVCGSAARLGRSTHDVFLRIYKETHPEATDEDAEAWLLVQKEDRYLSDVFG
ncbi:hypothetical protein NKR23_g10415 [Pleurostoma richardsiae]|uniref:Bifunctional cytochrome P450/NADPH--P450 reductase n=1 Tax=Pleurostoma richardsiae TaxID=41990 RepID=A0AA38VLM5_9PEZI|nr:hypothetical protein NKR23_g10415 [Pleurostoma richardsiae]